MRVSHLEPRDVLTTEGAADYLGISRKRVARLCSEGKLPAVDVDRRWLILVKDLAEFAATRRVAYWVTHSKGLTPAPRGARLSRERPSGCG